MKRLRLLSLVVLMAGLVLSCAATAGQAPPAATPATQPAELVEAASKALQTGDFGAAEVSLRRAIRLGTRDPQAHNLLGFICDQTGRSEEAFREYQQALQLSPRFTPARNNLGSFYLRQGKVALALDQFQLTLKLDLAMATPITTSA